MLKTIRKFIAQTWRWILCHVIGYHELVTPFLERGGSINPEIVKLITNPATTAETFLEIVSKDTKVYCKHCRRYFTPGSGYSKLTHPRELKD